MTRLLADENVSRFVVERLRETGFDIASIASVKPSASDAEVLQLALREQRIVVTEDRDFGEMVVRKGFGVLGVILLELDRLSNDAEAELAARVISANANRLRGNPIVIEPGRVRIRPLQT